MRCARAVGDAEAHDTGNEMSGAFVGEDSKPLLRVGNVRNGRRIGVFYWVLFLFACGFEVNGSGCGCGVGVGVCVYLPHPYVR